jgi:hypothetical protein
LRARARRRTLTGKDILEGYGLSVRFYEESGLIAPARVGRTRDACGLMALSKASGPSRIPPVLSQCRDAQRARRGAKLQPGCTIPENSSFDWLLGVSVIWPQAISPARNMSEMMDRLGLDTDAFARA